MCCYQDEDIKFVNHIVTNFYCNNEQKQFSDETPKSDKNDLFINKTEIKADLEVNTLKDNCKMYLNFNIYLKISKLNCLIHFKEVCKRNEFVKRSLYRLVFIILK